VRMHADPVLGPFVEAEAIVPARFVGRAPEQVDEFLADFLGPLLARHDARRGRFTSGVRV
jgi:adenylosuccinate lyase